jgi:hypothetical protein
MLKHSLKFALSVLAAASFGCVKFIASETNGKASESALTATPKPKKESKKMTEIESEKYVKDVALTCQIDRSEDKFSLKYTVKNNGKNEIYVLDSYPAYDSDTEKRFAESKSFYLSLREPNTAYLLRGIPPLPEDKLVTVRIMPLGTKLLPQQNIERTLEISLPLTEQNKWYYTPLEAGQYQKTTVNLLFLEVEILRSTVEGFKTEPVPFAPELFNVRGSNTGGQAEKIRCENKIENTDFLKRTDAFTRL